ncbi:MAG: hypothetical protein KGL77_01745 [Actinomycetales bacterium]|nr:hypothetical protein [Actinomycetales bacterium]
MTKPEASKPFNGDCAIVTDVVARVTLQLSVLPTPGAEFPSSEEDVRQRIWDGGWKSNLEYGTDLSHADSDLVRNQENYTPAEQKLISDYESVAGEILPRTIMYPGDTNEEWNSKLEDWLSRMSTAMDNLSASCKA